MELWARRFELKEGLSGSLALFLEDAGMIVLHGQDSGWKELREWPRVGRGCSSLGGLEGAHWEAAACHSSKAVQLLYLMFSL